jgi:antagonist of KipI
LLTTVQDDGRPEAMALGVTRSGACDPLALAAANLLCGNPRNAAALEINLLGPELRVLRSAVIAMTGADCEVRLQPSGALVQPGTAAGVVAGTVIAFGAARTGVRSYLAVGGGFDVPRVLGSASTVLQGGFGGVEGRALRTGDTLHAGAPESLGDWLPTEVMGRRWPGPGASSGVVERDPIELRLLPGPHASLQGGRDWQALLNTTWEVDPHSDRVGVRLRARVGDPPPRPQFAGARPSAAGILSMPMVWGAVEMPPGGSPICLLADHPTVGGYPVIGVVASVDLPMLGQLAPSTAVVCRAVTLAEATAAAERAASELDAAEALLRPGRGSTRIPTAGG